jgi:hypothetical protein
VLAPGLTGRVPALLLEAFATGCGLRLRHPLRPEDVAIVESAGPPLPLAWLSVRVTRVTEEGNGQRLGAEFLAPLSAAELRELLG